MEATFEEIVVHALGGEWGLSAREAGDDPEMVRVRVIRGTEFRDWERDKGSTAAERYIKRSSLAKRQLAVGDLVIEVSGGGASQPVGRALIIDEEAVRRADAPLVCSNFCRQVRVHRDLDPAYIHLALTFQYLCGRFDEHQTQTTNIRNLNFKSFLSGVIVPLPPAAEQRRIVARLQEAQKPLLFARESVARLPEILKRLRQSVLASAFTGQLTEEWRETRKPVSEPLAERLQAAFRSRREAWEMACCEAEAFDRRAPRRPKNLEPSEWEAPGPLEVPELPEGWCLVALHDVVHRVQYGYSSKAQANRRTGIPMLRMSNIQDGKIDRSDLKYVPRSEVDFKTFQLRRGDILFNRTNSPELVGKAAVFDLDLKAVFASYLVRIECDSRLVDSRYLCAWINSPWGRRWARTVRTESVSQANINISRLVAMPVPIPSLAEQREIVRRIEQGLALAGQTEKAVATAAEQTDKLWRTVLARAMWGELVPTEEELHGGEGGSGFEPAADLLDRISADRLATQAGGLVMAPETAGAQEEVVEAILAAVRQSCWGKGAMTREELVRMVATRLGTPKFGKTIRARLERHIEIALRRKIVAQDGEKVFGATPTFGRYDYNFLVRTLRALMKSGVDYEKPELVNAVAAYLGFGQVTPAMRDRMERVFQWAEQNELLEVRDGWVRWRE